MATPPALMRRAPDARKSGFRQMRISQRAPERWHGPHDVPSAMWRKLSPEALLLGRRSPRILDRSISTQYDAGGNERKERPAGPAPDGQFAVPDGHRITGVSSYLDANGNVAAQWVKTRSGPDPAEVARLWPELLPLSSTTPLGQFQNPSQTQTLLPSMRLQTGTLTFWHGAGNGRRWDTTIAQTDIMAGVRRVMASSPNSAVGVVLGLGDILHADGFEPFTNQIKERVGR